MPTHMDFSQKTTAVIIKMPKDDTMSNGSVRKKKCYHLNS